MTSQRDSLIFGMNEYCKEQVYQQLSGQFRRTKAILLKIKPKWHKQSLVQGEDCSANQAILPDEDTFQGFSKAVIKDSK